MDTKIHQEKLLEQLDEIIDRLLQTVDLEATQDSLKQFSAIDAAITQLAASGTPVPPSMLMIRQELEDHAVSARESLRQISDRLQAALDRTRTRAGNMRPKKSQREPLGISRARLKEAIVESLRDLGGAASRAQLVEHLRETLQYFLGPEDLELTTAGRERWLSRASKARRQLVREGVVEEREGILTLMES